jgi:cytoskeletal protein CcmA (bactofilin family)
MMEKETRYDLKINGAGSASGGAFNAVEINGEGKINGDVDCLDFRINGASNVKGSVQTGSGKINGRSVIGGNLAAEAFKISGSIDIYGNASVKEIKVEGFADIKGGLSAEEVDVKGGIKVKGDCSAEVFRARGSFNVGGLLNAGSIDIVLYGNCQAREIGGEKINIRRDKGNKIRRLIGALLPFNNQLDTETIEGDDIHLEYTRAGVVRGNNVSIGAGCDIGLVEYRNDFQQDREASVKDSRKASPE